MPEPEGQLTLFQPGRADSTHPLLLALPNTYSLLYVPIYYSLQSFPQVSITTRTAVRSLKLFSYIHQKSKI